MSGRPQPRTFDYAALRAKLGGADDIVRALLDVALQSTSTVPAALRDAASRSDFETLAGLAHKVKGTAGDFVAEALRNDARSAELAARGRQNDAVVLGVHLADRVEEFLAELRWLPGATD